MWDIVKLRDNVMPYFWATKARGLMYLGTEMAKDEDSGLVFPQQDGADQ